MKRLGFNLIAMIGCFVIGLFAVSALSFMQLHPKANIPPANIQQVVMQAETRSLRPECDVRYLPESEIHRVDFLNFAYPMKEPYYARVQDTIKLVDGKSKFSNFKEEYWSEVEIKSENITYADLTGDGIEEAIIDISPHYSTFGIDRFIYIYTMEGKRTKLLRFFSVGGRARVGELKEMYVQDGDLILEFYGKNKVSDKAIEVATITDYYMCDRCYKEFTRARFHWNGKRFEQKGEAEIYPLDSSNIYQP